MEPTSKTPFFLIGVQRTGSTLLRLMLNHHPEIACMHAFTSNILRKEKDGSTPDFETLQKRMVQDRQYRPAGLELDSSLDYHQQLKRIYALWRQDHGEGKSTPGVTLHFRYLLALELWPDAKFIHLVRDPRDVAPSFINLGWAGNTWHATDHWVKAELEVEALNKLIPDDRIVHLRFEDLVYHPEKQLTRVCELLDLPYNPQMLSYPEHTSYKLPDRSIAERWRTKMEKRDVQLIEARTGSMMTSRGYELSGHPALKIEGVLRTRLEVQNRMAKLRYRMNRYGAKPVLISAAASRLGLEKISLEQQKKMQDHDLKNLA